MGTEKTGSGIVLVGYADYAAGIVLCRDCGDNGDGMHMEPVYSTDVNGDADEPRCFSCDAALDR